MQHETNPRQLEELKRLSKIARVPAASETFATEEEARQKIKHAEEKSRTE